MSDNITTWDPPGDYTDWYNAAYWTNGVPDRDKIAVVPKHTVSTDNKDVAVKELRVLGSGWVSVAEVTAEKVLVADDGQFDASTITVSDEFRFAGGQVSSFGGLNVPPTATLRIEGTDKKEFNAHGQSIRVRGKGVLNFKGHHLNITGDLDIDITGVVEVDEEAKFEGAGSVSNSGRLEIAAPMHLLQGVDLKNSDLGTLQIAIPDHTAAQLPRITLESDNSCYLDGKLVLALGFEPADGASVQVLSYSQYHRQGKFTEIESVASGFRWQANYGETALSVTRLP
ncbi:hypothetical protein [Mycobacterium sp. E2733]|uniref:hypothetical protein n=1 Tax=Mycobacterium sp. E2733 TaxID=1834138 RepID=UPI0007FDDE0B|nr:hypothetical protein [Mycobacterium sp. E2733]OBI00513.1 hypothetical protein A5678_18685 [Mycobacterium sp. E2733]